MKVTGSSNVETMTNEAGGITDPEVALAARAVMDSARRAEQSRAARDSARADRTALLKRSAEKLRDMADMALSSKLLQFAQSLNSMGGSDKSALGKGLALAAQLDPFEVAKNYQQVDKQMLDNGADVASYRVQDTGGNLSDAERRESLMQNLAEKLSDAVHTARMAAIRG